MYHRIAQRDSLRAELPRAEDPEDATSLRRSISKLNSEIAGIRVQLGFTDGFVEPVEAPAAQGPQIIIVRSIWALMTEDERERLSKSYLVGVRDGQDFGVIMDAQTVDQSTAGNNAGSALGAAVGNAAYIDRSFRPGGNYSATTQLAAGLVGAAIGSSLNQAPSARFRTRYAVRLADGNIRYAEIVQSDPFRHPMGVCLDTVLLQLPDQSTCTQTLEIVRARWPITRPADAR